MTGEGLSSCSWIQVFGLRRMILVCALYLLDCSIHVGLAAAVSDQFYDPSDVQTIRLEIKPEDLNRMHHALPQRIYVPGVFRWNQYTIEEVGIRYKGNSSSMPESSHKRSFLIAFSEFKKGQRFLDLRHAALDNAVQFGSLFSERLITDNLREHGIKASRCNYARVFVNEEYLGVYVNVERIDQAFIEQHFRADRGILFKVDEGGPGADLHYLGSDSSPYQKTFELHSGNSQKAYRSLLEFIQMVNAPSGTESDLRQSMDIESFAKTTAVLLFSGAFDQYTGWGPHNYYLYHNPTDQRWTYIPWDLDVGFADKAFGQVPVLDGWHAAWPVPVPGRPLMERMISHTNILRWYRAQASSILEASFKPEILIPKLRKLYDQIRPDLEKDPYPPRRVTVPSDQGYADILASMETFIRKRYTLAHAQLNNPGDRPQPQPMSSSPNHEGPQPGPPSADAPRDLRAVRVTPSSVQLSWVDRAEGEVAYVVQRCIGANNTNFINAIGQGGADNTTAIDRDVKPGATYRYRVYAVFPTPQGPRGTGVSNMITVLIPTDQSTSKESEK